MGGMRGGMYGGGYGAGMGGPYGGMGGAGMLGPGMQPCPRQPRQSLYSYSSVLRVSCNLGCSDDGKYVMRFAGGVRGGKLLVMEISGVEENGSVT